MGPRYPGTVATAGGYDRRNVVDQKVRFEVPDWNLKEGSSSAVSWNMKSSGKRSRFRCTALFRLLVRMPSSAGDAASPPHQS
jgi:hypothetical protein